MNDLMNYAVNTGKLIINGDCITIVNLQNIRINHADSQELNLNVNLDNNGNHN